MRKQTNILDPDNRHIKVFTCTPVTDVGFLHDRLLTAKKSLLHLPERTARLDQINTLHARGKAFEIPEGLFRTTASS